MTGDQAAATLIMQQPIREALRLIRRARAAVSKMQDRVAEAVGSISTRPHPLEISV
jgi:hypothetical protein